MATKYIFYFSDTSKVDFSLYPYTANGPVSPSDGTLIDRAVAQNTTLKLYGKGMQDYGEGIEQNMIYMLENFANLTAPVNPIEGQLWYKNAATGSPEIGPELFIYNGATWDAAILSTGTSAMTGELVLFGDPVNALGAVPKQYIDAHIGLVVPNDPHLTGNQNTFLDNLNLPSLSATHVNFVEGVTSNIQTQLNNKIRRTGDAMDAGAGLTFSGGGNLSLTGSNINLNTGSDINMIDGNIIMNIGGGSPLPGTISGLPEPTANDHVANKKYVDDQILFGGADGVLSTVTFEAGTGSPYPDPTFNTLKFTIFGGGSPSDIRIDGISRVGHDHDATEININQAGSPLPLPTITGANVQAALESIDLLKAPKASPTFGGNVNVTGVLTVNGSGTFGGQVTAAEPVNSTHLATKNYVDNVAGAGTGGGTAAAAEFFITRTLESLGSPLSGSPEPAYPVQAHLADDNKLSIYINGIKQAGHTYGRQSIQYDTAVGFIGETVYTGLDQTLDYVFDINVDGAGAVTIIIPNGTNTITHGSLVTAINDAMAGASPQLALAGFSIEDNDVQTFVSYSSGTNSTIAITDPGIGSPDTTVYLFATDPSPIAIVSAVFRSESPDTSPQGIPDDIIIDGDVTALFPAGKAFTIRGSEGVVYGNYDSVYRVHSNGPIVAGSPQQTYIPIAWVGDFNQSIPLLGAYQPGGSPTPIPPLSGSPAKYGDVHFTPIGGFDQILTATAGAEGTYAETDSSGNTVEPGGFTDHVVFHYSIPSGAQIETTLLS